jgi:predicted alpha/beta-fold hydrolase
VNSADGSQMVSIAGLESRNQVPLLEGRNRTTVRCYQQKFSGPLIFMVTGTGSNSSAGYAVAQAQRLYRMGYQVAILSSPLNWSFVLAENQTGELGYTPDEAQDLYEYMGKVVSILKAKRGLQVSSYSIIGYSIGGAEVAFISLIDQQQHQFNFEKILLVNPPLDLHYAINTLDQLLGVAANWRPQKTQYVQGLIFSKGIDLISRNGDDPNYFYGFEKTEFAETDYAKFLIGLSFRATLGVDIFASEQISDTGLLKKKASKNMMSAREEEARSISFNDFSRWVVLPRVSAKHALPNDQVFETASLRSIRQQLAQNPHIFILHNADDFLTGAQDLEDFQEAFGVRMTVFPSGGHLGNLWYPQNIAKFEEIFR